MYYDGKSSNSDFEENKFEGSQVSGFVNRSVKAEDFYTPVFRSNN